MSEDKVKQLKSLLGPEWDEEELRELLKGFPKLPESTEELIHSLRQLREESSPAPSFDFTEKVMGRVGGKAWWINWFRRWGSLRRLSYATAALGLLLIGFYLFPQWWEGPIQPRLQIVGEEGRSGKDRVYLVRFALQRPAATSVALMGDFNRWKGTRLKKRKKGIFTAEISLPRGTYAYGFLVDGKEWVPDTTAPRIVPDGYGRRNSLINL